MSELSGSLHRRKAITSSLRWLPLLLIGTTLGLWWLNTPAGLMGKADALAYAVCHRIDLRSFHLGERALPLCARCTGMYLGALISLLFFGISGRGKREGLPNLKVALLLTGIGLAWAVDGLNSYAQLFPDPPLTLYPPNNQLRLITGLGLGLGLAAILLPGFNGAVRGQADQEPILQGYGEMVPLFGLLALVFLAVTSENPLFLYPLALLSAFTVVLVLTMVYTMALFMVLNRGRTASSWLPILPTALLGGTLALVQIGVLDLLRYLWQGSWGGLHF